MARRTLLLATAVALSVLTIEARGGDAVDPVRGAVATAVGPVERVADGAVRPFRDLATAMRSNSSLRGDVATLQAQNSRLRGQLNASGVDRARLAAYDALTRTSFDTGYTLVPSRVVGVGAAQTFRRTVTIDAGLDAGVRPDATVVAPEGLVGRVLTVTRSTATVLLIADTDSVVGGRLGSTMKIGFIKGRGALGERGRLDLELVDNAATPAIGDAVVSWGSRGSGPYVAGIGIGTVQRVFSSPRELSKRAVVKPYVDFGSLDVVGVVVARGTESDRALVRPDGTLR